jgi:hypothetical protein
MPSPTLSVAADQGSDPPDPAQPFDVRAADAESPGCAHCGRPDCLEDVVFDRVTPMERVPATLNDVEDVEGFVAWAARIATAMEMGLDFDAACEARDQYDEAITAAQVGEAIRSSIEAGLTLAQTVTFWDVDVTTLIRRWSNNPHVESGEPWLQAERLMGSTLETYKHIGELVGLSPMQMKTLSTLLERNGRSPRRVLLDLLQSQARTLQADGLPALVIAKRMSRQHDLTIGKARVEGWLRADRRAA